jgi:hypothetical protein
LLQPNPPFKGGNFEKYPLVYNQGGQNAAEIGGLYKEGKKVQARTQVQTSNKNVDPRQN